MQRRQDKTVDDNQRMTRGNQRLVSGLRETEYSSKQSNKRRKASNYDIQLKTANVGLRNARQSPPTEGKTAAGKLLTPLSPLQPPRQIGARETLNSTLPY